MEQPAASVQTLLKRRSRFKAWSFSRWLVALYLTAAAIHLIAVIPFLKAPIALDDMFQYDMLARSIQHGDGYRWYARADFLTLKPYYSSFLEVDASQFPENGIRTAWRAPGYPFWLAALYLLVPVGGRFILARLAQAALLAALAPLAAALARQLGASERTALVAGAGVSLYPILLFYPIALASENLYIPLATASLLAILLAAKRASPRIAALAGLLTGATMLTRSVFALSALLAGLWLLRFAPRRRIALVFFLVAFGVCLPWSVRNSLIMGKPAFIENSAGYNMFISYHPQGDGNFVSDIAIQPMNIIDDAQRDRICTEQALAFIRADPGEAARRILARVVSFLGVEDREFFYFYSNNLIGAIPQPWLALLYLLLVVPWSLALIFGIAGMWHAPERAAALLLALFLLGYALPHLLIIAEPRFHLAWVPLLAPLAAVGWNARAQLFRRASAQRDSLLLAALLLAILVVLLLDIYSDLPRVMSVMRAGGNLLRFPY